MKLFFLFYIYESCPVAVTSGVEGMAGDGRGDGGFQSENT
jgi:hypothetical protein